MPAFALLGAGLSAVPLLGLLALVAGVGAESESVSALRAGLLGRAWFTLWQSVVATGLALVFGLAAARMLASTRRTWPRVIALLPLLVPPLSTAFGMAQFLRIDVTTGTAMRDLAIVLVHAVHGAAIVAALAPPEAIAAARARADTARLLGAATPRPQFEAWLRRMLPHIVAGAGLAYLLAATSPAAALVLARSGEETLAATLVRHGSEGGVLAGLLGFTHVAIGLGVLLAVLARGWATSRDLDRGRPAPAESILPLPSTPLAALTLGFAMLVLGPLGALLATSFTLGDGAFTLAHWGHALLGASEDGHAAGAMWSASLAAVFAALEGAGLALLFIERSAPRLHGPARLAAWLPVALPAGAVALGYAAWTSSPAGAGALTMMLAYASLGFAVVLPAASSRRGAFSPRAEVARLAGMSGFRRVRYVCMMSPPSALVAILGVAAVTALGDAGTPGILEPAAPPIALAALELAGRGGDAANGAALALAALLALLAAGVLGLVVRSGAEHVAAWTRR